MTVASSGANDYKASTSSYGGCVELYAPGVNIPSAWLYGGTNTISGTSMATPHVAGAGALYLQNNPSAAPATVNNWIISNAAPNVIYNNPSSTPNRLLFIGDASTPPPPPPTPTPWERPPPDCGTYYC